MTDMLDRDPAGSPAFEPMDEQELEPEFEDDDPFEEWDRHPVDTAQENVGYQRLAWHAAPFGDAGVSVVLLAFVLNGLRRIGRATIRLLLR